MRTYMVCVDGSACGNYAFHETLKLIQPGDLLLICHCVQDVYLSNSGFIGRAPLNLVNLKPVQQSTDAAGRQLLEWYIAKAKRLGHTNVKAVLGVTNTEGEFICRIAKQRKVDYIVIGRRGLSGFKRFFIGSTSSHVMEQAEANVIVVHEDWPYKAQLSKEPAAGEMLQPHDIKKSSEELEAQRRHEEEKAIHTMDELEHQEHLMKTGGPSGAEASGLQAPRKFSARVYDVEHRGARSTAGAGEVTTASKQ